MKKFKNAILIVTLILSLLLMALPVFAADGPIGGRIPGSEIDWKIENGTLTLSADSEVPVEMPDFEETDSIPWNDYIPAVTRIVVGDNIVTVGDLAFYGCGSCTEIILPENLYSIGCCAFQWSAQLEHIELPKALACIEYDAFFFSGLKEINIPEGVTEIGKRAFAYNWDLAYAVIPSTVTSIGIDVFGADQRLKDIVVKANTLSIFIEDRPFLAAFETEADNDTYIAIRECIEFPEYSVPEFIVEKLLAFDENADETWTDAEWEAEFNAALHAAITEWCNLKTGSHFADYDEILSYMKSLWIDDPDAYAGAYVTVYCNEGSVQQQFCEEHGLTYSLLGFDCVNGTEHKNLYINADFAPTCTQNGYRGGIVCLDCEKVIKAPLIVEPTGHTPVTDGAVAPTCTNTGLTAGSHCAECGLPLVLQEVIPAEEHTDENGDGVCDVCGNETSSKAESPFRAFIRVMLTLIDKILAIFRKIFG